MCSSPPELSRSSLEDEVFPMKAPFTPLSHQYHNTDRGSDCCDWHSAGPTRAAAEAAALPNLPTYFGSVPESHKVPSKR